MKERDYDTGDEVRIMFKGTECSGLIIRTDGDTYTVSFVYSPGDGRAPESVIYTITEKNIL